MTRWHPLLDAPVSSPWHLLRIMVILLSIPAGISSHIYCTWVIQSRKMRWSGHIACTRENVHGILWKNILIDLRQSRKKYYHVRCGLVWNFANFDVNTTDVCYIYGKLSKILHHTERRFGNYWNYKVVGIVYYSEPCKPSDLYEAEH